MRLAHRPGDCAQGHGRADVRGAPPRTKGRAYSTAATDRASTGTVAAFSPAMLIRESLTI